MQRRVRKGKRIAKREKPITRLWRWYRRKYLCEYLCDECSKPYNEKPKGIEVEQFVSGSSSAMVFVEESYGRKNHYVEFARVKAYGDKMRLSPLFSIDHLSDVARVAAQAHSFIRADRSTRKHVRRMH